MIIVIIVAAVLVLAGAVFVVSRRMRRSRIALASPPRAAMPTVLVREVTERPTLDDTATLGHRLGA
ncbi:MAG: hypothetical protein ABI298_03970, partial [Acidimicrobiales bacterium]